MEKIIVALFLIAVSFSAEVSGRRSSPKKDLRFTPEQKYYFTHMLRQYGRDSDEDNSEGNISADFSEISSLVLPPNEEKECTEPGFFKKTCLKFYRCVNMSADGGPPFMSYNFDCPSGTVYNPKINVCDHEFNVPECKGQSFIPGASNTALEDIVDDSDEDKKDTSVSDEDSNESEDDSKETDDDSKETDDDSKETDDDSDEDKESKEDDKDSDEDEDKRPPAVFTLDCFADRRYVQHPLYCNKYYVCFQDDLGIWEVSSQQCPPDFIFSEANQMCQLPGRNDEPCQTAPSDPVDKITEIPEGVQPIDTASIDNDESDESLPVVPPEEVETPDEGKETPNEVEVTDELEESTPFEYEDTPSEGEVAPSEGEVAPSEGEVAPIEGEVPPNEGEVATSEDDSSEEDEAIPFDVLARRRATPDVEKLQEEPYWKVEADSLFNCPSPGFFPYENDCNRFYKCVATNKKSLTGLLYLCPHGYGYSEDEQACVEKEKMEPCSRRPFLMKYVAATQVYDDDLLWFFNN